MFRAIRFIIALPVLAAAVLVVFYFLPAHTKEWTFTKLTGIVPAKLETKAREFLMTPPEERSKLIHELEVQLAELRKEEFSTATEPLFETTDDIVQKLKAKNTEQSLAGILKTKAAEKIVNSVFGTTTQCVPQ